MHRRSRLDRLVTYRPWLVRAWPLILLIVIAITGIVIAAVTNHDVANDIRTFLQTLRRAL